MNGSVKLFIVSLIVFAASAGFFAGSLCNKPCPRGSMAVEGSAPSHHLDGKGPHGDFKGHGPKGPRGDFGKGPSPELLDSLLQVTPEQKAALEKNRSETDSIFKELRKNKFEAEKALGEALDSEDSAAIETAKGKVSEAHKALLDHRINSVAALSKILTREQREKFRNFHKENMKKFMKHKGPRSDFQGQKSQAEGPQE